MAGKKNFKKVKFENNLKDDVNMILRQELSDSRLQFVSITRVNLSPDYAYADLFWDTFDAGKRGDTKKALVSSLPKIRAILAKKLKMKAAPELRLEYDSQFEAESQITSLIEDDVNSDNNE